MRATALPTKTFDNLAGTTACDALSRLGWQVDAGHKGLSLGESVAAQLYISVDVSRDLIDFGSVQIDGRAERDPGRKLNGGEQVKVFWPKDGIHRWYEVDGRRILYHDRHLLAYDKESGIPSQQTPSDAYNNLFAALYRFVAEKSVRPYLAPHHRLDGDTSGVMLFAVDQSVNRKLGNAFKHHNIAKDYLAWVEGYPKRDEWIAREDIGRKAGSYRTFPQGQGKSAETWFKVLLRREDRSFIWARPRTGRTHQIRLHLASSGHPVIGDRLYGTASTQRLLLHAYRLSLLHPATDQPLVLTAPVPADWPERHNLAIPPCNASALCFNV